MQNWSLYSHALTPRFTLHASHLHSITVVQGPQWGMLGVLSAIHAKIETPRTCWCWVVIMVNLAVSLWIYTYQIECPTNISGYTVYIFSQPYTIHTPQLFCTSKMLHRMYATSIWGMDKLRGQRLGGMFTMLPHKQPCACATWGGVAAWYQQLCWVSNVLQNFLCYSDYSSVTSIVLIAQKAPGTDHGNTVLQFTLAVSSGT